MLVASGCTPPPVQITDTSGPKALDRFVAAYPEDLVSKRFQVVADFEEPKQAGLFRREPDRDAQAVQITTARARQDTGAGALRVSLLNSSQQVVVADAPESQWSLHADWAPYQLLLISVYSPRDQGGFRFSIRSGMNTPLVYQHTRTFLKSGWNQLRIDLGDVAEAIYLGDVREMRFWCDPLDSPIELYLDDIILVDNSRELVANPGNTPGELSLKSAGRRLMVTAAERFELVFHQGRIRQWFDLGSDPQRLHNLAGGGCLGPIPVLMGPRGEVTLEAAQWSQLGPVAESYQTVVEASPVRVVIHGEWRFGSPESPISETSPNHRWVYSIYRGGEVYVECSGTIPGAGASEVGLVFGCDGAAGFKRTIQQPRPAGSREGQAAYVLFAQPAAAGSADLLVVPARELAARELTHPDNARVCAIYPLPVESDQFLFAGMMRVWPNEIDSPTQAGPMAQAYAQPMPLAVDTGSLLRTDPGDFDGDGFSEARGYYVLQLDGRVAKVRLDGRDHLRFSPAFKLVDVTDYDVWVYVDGRQIKKLPRDQNGNVLFEVPGVISREILIEINATRRQAAPAAAVPAKP